MINAIILTVAMTIGVNSPDNTDYWNGYAASVVAKQLAKGNDVIHEGKPHPKKDEPVAKPIEQEKPVIKVDKATPPAAKAKAVESPPPTVLDEATKESLIQEIKDKAAAILDKMPDVSVPAPKEVVKNKANNMPMLPPPPKPVPEKKVEAQYPNPSIEDKHVKVLKTFAEAMQFSKDNDNCLMLLVFSTDGCPPCISLHHALETADMQALLLRHGIKAYGYFNAGVERWGAEQMGCGPFPTSYITSALKAKKGMTGYNFDQYVKWISE